MAGPHTYCNLLPIGKDKPTKGASTNDSDTSAVSCTFIPALPQVFIPAQAPAPIPGTPNKYTDEKLQKAIKLVLELYV